MPVEDGPAAPPGENRELPALDSPELETVAREYWASTMRACGGSTEPDPLDGEPIPIEFYRWL